MQIVVIECEWVRMGAIGHRGAGGQENKAAILALLKPPAPTFTEAQQDAMYRAARAGDGARVLALEKETPGLAAAGLDKHGLTALHVIAISAPDVAASGEAITQVAGIDGVNVDARDEYKRRTPLHVASAFGNLHQVRALLRSGATVDVKDKGGATPMSVCCKGVDVGQENKAAILALLKMAQKRAMMAAAKAGDGARVLALEKAAPGLAAADLNGTNMTALHYIAFYAPDVVASGEAITQLWWVDIDVRDEYGRTPLLYASMRGKLHQVRALVQSGATVNVKSKWGSTPASECCNSTDDKKNRAAILALFFTEAQKKAMREAAKAGDGKEVVALEKATPGLAGTDLGGMGDTALHLIAAHAPDVPTSEEAIAQVAAITGIDIDARNRWGRTPLHEACMKGKLHHVRALVQSGASVHIKDNEGDTPKDVIEGGEENEAAILTLLGGPAPAYARIAMRDAAIAGNGPRMLDLVQKHGVALTGVIHDDGYETALHYISSSAPDVPASAESIQQLAAFDGVDVNARDTVGGSTPLHLASKYGKVHQVRALLRSGADADAKDIDGATPGDEANKKAILALLRGEPEAATEAAAEAAPPTKKKKKAMANAAKTGEWARIGPLVQAHPGLASADLIGSNEGFTALHFVAWNAPDTPASVESIQHLTAIDGVDVDARDNEDWTPLLYASTWGKVHQVRALLESGADANAVGGTGRTPAQTCCNAIPNRENKPAILALLRGESSTENTPTPAPAPL